MLQSEGRIGPLPELGPVADRPEIRIGRALVRMGQEVEREIAALHRLDRQQFHSSSCSVEIERPVDVAGPHCNLPDLAAAAEGLAGIALRGARLARKRVLKQLELEPLRVGEVTHIADVLKVTRLGHRNVRISRLLKGDVDVGQCDPNLPIDIQPVMPMP